MNIYDETNIKQKYISKISEASDRYGNLLIELMDRHNVSNLRELSEEQVIAFYNESVVQNENNN